MPNTKIATCCYCGARAALVLNKAQHELSCASCGAPLHDLKMLRADAVNVAAHAPAQRGKKGKTRHVGVANFNIAMVEESMRLCPEPLCVLQAEYHPYLRQTKVLDFCRRAGLIFMAYCPLGRGRVFQDPVLAGIAKKRGKTIAQIALRWLVQQGNIAPIPRSSNPKHMAESLQIFDFSLTEEEMNRIHALAHPDGRIANPKGRAPAWD